MSFGPYSKALGIDEEVLSGQKTLTIDIEQMTNGVAWELRKHKISKKLSTKDAVDWFIKILGLKCENVESLEDDLNQKFEKLASFRGMFLKSPKIYPGEVERLMKFRFDLPQSMGIEPGPVFEPMERANLGPKLLKVLKEKGADVDDSMDMSGPSDDDDEQAKRRKAREEINQLKKDLGSMRKIIMGLNDRINDVSKRCTLLADVTKISVSERRRIECDLTKLKTEWNAEIKNWHDCIDRLSHASMNKNMYLDVGYMVRRNKTKQSIFDELNQEFEKTIEEFKQKVNSLLNKERQKKKPAARDYKQKSKSDRKRVRQDADDDKSEESKKICLSEETVKAEPTSMPVEEFVKSETVEEFMNGKFTASLKAIYSDLLSMAIPCKNVQEIVFSVLSSLEGLNVEKIPVMSFAGNLYMEIRMLALIQAYSDRIKLSKVNISNDGTTKFELVGGSASYEVTMPDATVLTLGVRDLSSGSQDTSVNFLKELFGQIISLKFEGSSILNDLSLSLRLASVTYGLLEKRLLDIIFLYKQQILPKVEQCLDVGTSDCTNKLLSMNNFCTGLYFLLGLADLVDVTVLAWESMSQSAASDRNLILSQTAQNLNDFCETLESSGEFAQIGKEFVAFLKKDKKLESIPLAPNKEGLFNTIFHNSAGVWFFHDIGAIPEFAEAIEAKEAQLSPALKAFTDKRNLAVLRALGLIGKLIAVPLWTMLEDADTVEVGVYYVSLLKKLEVWSKDATKFIQGQEYILEEQEISHDAVFVSLIKDDESSHAVTKEVLELLFTAFIPYLQSFLYGSAKPESTRMNGDTSMDVDVDVKTNIHRDFKAIDRITRSLHSRPTYAFDALTHYSKTRNGEWQDKLATRNNLKIFDVIQKNANKQLKSLYKRKIRLIEMKEQTQEKKEEFSKCQLVEKRYKLIDDLIKWGGLWKSEKEVDDRLKDMKETDRMNALKSQIKFRRHVLGEVSEGNLLDLAFDGEVFNSTKLYDNLKAILRNECQVTETDDFELASATDVVDLKIKIYDSCKAAQEIEDVGERQSYGIKENFYWLLGKKLQHTFVKSGVREPHAGVCIARKKINGVYFYFMRYKDVVYKFSENKVAEDYRNKSLQVVEPLAKELVGMKMSRAFYKDDGYLEWYDCCVIASAGGSEYIVEFDYYGSTIFQDPNDENPLPQIETLTFTCNILEDYRTGQLRFL